MDFSNDSIRQVESILAEVHKEYLKTQSDPFPFHFAGGTIFPYGWCVKRIFDGPGDDIWSKYQVLVLQRRT